MAYVVKGREVGYDVMYSAGVFLWPFQQVVEIDGFDEEGHIDVEEILLVVSIHDLMGNVYPYGTEPVEVDGIVNHFRSEYQDFPRSGYSYIK